MNKKIKVPRQVRSQQVKEKIFQTALELMLGHGYEYVTVSNVCTAAGISTGSFYHQFSNKDELLSYYFVHGIRKYQKRFDEIKGPDIVKVTTAMYEVHVQHCLDQGIGFIKSFYTPHNQGLSARPSTEYTSVNLPIVTRSTNEFSLARESGHLPEECNPRDLAVELCILVKGCIFEWCVENGGFDLMQLSQKMIKQYMHGAVTPKYFADFP